MAKKKRRLATRKSKKKQPTFGGMSSGHGLGAIHTVEEFRDAINAQPSLSTDERLRLIEQASVRINQTAYHVGFSS